MPGEGTERLIAEGVERERERFFGKFRGLVTDVGDPDGMGRIRAQIPEVLGDAESPWAMPCVPFAGDGHGLVLLPEVGDGVWMEFEGGDLSRPIWTGGWWARGELPAPGSETVRALVTTPGHEIYVDEGASEIVLRHPGSGGVKPEVKLGASEIKISLGAAEITVTAQEIKLKVGAGSVALTASSVELMGGAMTVGV